LIAPNLAPKARECRVRVEHTTLISINTPQGNPRGGAALVRAYRGVLKLFSRVSITLKFNNEFQAA
jgi:hypothetical protein